MLSSPYYAKNYAGIIDSGLALCEYCTLVSKLKHTVWHENLTVIKFYGFSKLLK